MTPVELVLEQLTLAPQLDPELRARAIVTALGNAGYLRTCPASWGLHARNSLDAPIRHRCAHPIGHPGRHVCSCRSWREREADNG